MVILGQYIKINFVHSEDIKKKIKLIAKSIFKDIVNIRRHIHKYPELSFSEKETSKFICAVLDKHEIDYKSNVAGFGVVAMIRCKEQDANVIGVRADMDALPIQEQNNIDYKSTNDGVMHACGHDAHSAMLLGTAIILNKIKDNLKGTVKFIFQPAEEKLPGGASLMIKEDVLKFPTVNKMFALHVYPEFKVGLVGFKSGKYMAACDEIYIDVHGKGGHAALPDQFINPITIACEIILKLRSAIANIEPIKENYILEFGDFHAHGASNVIPPKATLQGTLRTLDESFRKKTHKIIFDVIRDIESVTSSKCTVNIKVGYPVLFNNVKLTQSSKKMAQYFLGVDSVKDLDVRMSSEDFSYFSQECESCFFRIGVSNKNLKQSVHHPNFNIDENCLELGMGLMSFLVATNLLDQKRA